MAKTFSPVEIDFETGLVGETLETKLSCVRERLRVLKNPWTGNKKKLIVNIFSLIDKYNNSYSSILDLFSGSASVSIAAKYLGKKVICNDAMMFAYFNALAFVKNNSVELSHQEKKYLIDNYNYNYTTFVREHYANVRFSVNEAIFLDNYYANALELFGPLEERNIKFILSLIHILHYVMDKCFLGGRLNKGQVLAQLEHRLQHSKNQSLCMSFKDIHWVDMRLIDDVNKHECYCGDAISLLTDIKPKVDICYIDPPYGGQQSDYALMYSFFEEYICQAPISKLNHLEVCDKFRNRNNYNEHFSAIIEASSYIPMIVLSFNDESAYDISEIHKVLDNYRKRVHTHELSYRYHYRDQKKQGREYVIIAE